MIYSRSHLWEEWLADRHSDERLDTFYANRAERRALQRLSVRR